MADHVELAHLHNRRSDALLHWKMACEWASAGELGAESAAIAADVLARLGASGDPAVRDAVDQALYQAQRAHGRLGQEARQVALLEVLATRGQRLRTSQTLPALADLARLKLRSSGRLAAEVAWRRAVAVFRGGQARQAEEEGAAIAAEAAFELLWPHFEALVAMTHVTNFKGTFAQQRSQWTTHRQRLVERAEGPRSKRYDDCIRKLVERARKAEPPESRLPRHGRKQDIVVAGRFTLQGPAMCPVAERSGGLADDYSAFPALIGSCDWAIAAHVQRARIWLWLGRFRSDGPPEDPDDDLEIICESTPDNVPAILHERATSELRAAARLTRRCDVSDDHRAALYDALHGLIPAAYPERRDPIFALPALKTGPVTTGVLRNTPRDPTALLAAAEAVIASSERIGLARLMLDAALPPANAVQRAHIDYLRARADLAVGDWYRAKQHAMTAVAKWPGHAAAWIVLGVAWTHLRQGEEAVQALHKASELGENRYDVQVNLGHALRYTNQGDAWEPKLALARANQARVAFQSAAKLEPARPEAACGLAVVLTEHRFDDFASDEARFEAALAQFDLYERLRHARPSRSLAAGDHGASTRVLQRNEQIKRIR